MKVTEMEQALAAMSQQVDELQGVLKQNVALQVPTPCTCCPHKATHMSAMIACVHVYCVCGHVALVRLSLLLNVGRQFYTPSTHLMDLPLTHMCVHILCVSVCVCVCVCVRLLGLEKFSLTR